MLYIVATPIGNLKDMTLRAIETLQKVDGVICEDTRRSGLLLNLYKIKKPLLVLNDFNEARVVPVLLDKLKKGENLALVSDCGTPLISDPGYKLVRACISEKLVVDAIPGASSVITALVLSGLPPNNFTFFGYFPEKPKQRLDLLNNIKTNSNNLKTTNIFFASPYKLVKDLIDMETVFGDIEIVLAKELTKINQTVLKQAVSAWLNMFKSRPPKGEYVLLFQ